MTDIAGLAVGVAGAWKTCVQIFDIVDSGRKYGMEYELLRVKLEVERIRLLTWGDAASSTRSGRCSQYSPSPVYSMSLKILTDFRIVMGFDRRLRLS